MDGFSQNKVFDTITFFRGGKVYKLIAYPDSLVVNGIPYEGKISLGTTNQFYRGDKTWQTITGGGTTYTGTSPIAVVGSAISVTPDTLAAWRAKLSKANTAYGWGNHASLYQQRYNQNKKIVYLGNSITAFGWAGSSPTYWEYASSFYVMGNAILGHPFNKIITKGIGGNTTTQMLARFGTDVRAYAPGYCLIEGGVNDNDSATTIFTNLVKLYDSCVLNGIRPIAVTVMPNTALPFTAATNRQYARLNNMIRDYCRTSNIPLIDFDDVVTDKSSATWQWNSTYSNDGLHPNSSGAIALGKEYAKVIRTIISPMELYPISPVDPTVISTNHFMTGTTGTNSTPTLLSGNVATGFIAGSTCTTAVSKVARKYGEWQKIVISTTGLANITTNDITINYNIGDTIFALAEIETEDGYSQLIDAKITLFCYQNTTKLLEYISPHSLNSEYITGMPLSVKLKTAPMKIPTGTNIVKARVSIRATTGTFYVGRLCVKKQITTTSAKYIASDYAYPAVDAVQANTSTSGYLSATDWNTFNNKISSQWMTSGSNIYFSIGNIGISTSSPSAGLDVQSSSFVLGGNADPNASGSPSSTDATIVKQYSYSILRRSSAEIAKMDIGGIGFVPTIGTVYAMSNFGKFMPLSNLQYNFKRAYGYSHDIVMTDSTHSSVILKDSVFVPKIGKRTNDMSSGDSIIISVPVSSGYGGGTDSKMIRRMEVASVSALPFASKTHVHAVKGPLLITNDSIAISLANSSTSGYLSSADWNTFNNKINSQWTTSGSSIYFNSGNVGINNNTPSESLDVNGNIKANNVIQLSAMNNNRDYSGDIIPLTAGGTLNHGDVVFINNEGKAIKCIASSISNCPYAFAVCVSGSLSATQSGLFMTKGFYKNTGWNLTVGALLYVTKDGFNGESLSTTIPTASNSVVMPVAVALSATEIYFFGNMNSVEKL